MTPARAKPVPYTWFVRDANLTFAFYASSAARVTIRDGVPCVALIRRGRKVGWYPLADLVPITDDARKLRAKHIKETTP